MVQKKCITKLRHFTDYVIFFNNKPRTIIITERLAKVFVEHVQVFFLLKMHFSKRNKQILILKSKTISLLITDKVSQNGFVREDMKKFIYINNIFGGKCFNLSQSTVKGTYIGHIYILAIKI